MQAAKTVLIGIIVSLLCLTAHAADSRSKHVLVLHSYHRGFAFTEAEIEGIDSVLVPESGWIEQHVIHMDAKRTSDERYDHSLRQLLQVQFAKVRLDAILVTDNDALEFVVANRAGMFRDVPVFFAGVNDFQESMLAGELRITGVVKNTDYPATIDLALRLRPLTTQVVAITDSTTTGKAHSEAIQRLASAYRDKAEIVVWSLGDMSMEDMCGRLASLKEDSVVVLLNHYRDKGGHVFSHDESMERLLKASAVPVFAVNEVRLGWGVLGGRLIRGRNQGRIAAQMMLRVLRGEDIARVPIETKSPNDWMFDYPALRRWGIDESALPAGSIIVHRPVSFYGQHERVILGTLAVLLLLVAIIWLQATAIARRRVAEAALLKANNTYRALVACTSAVARANDEASLLHQVVQVVQQHCGYRMAWVGLAKHDDARTVRPVARAGFDDGHLEKVTFTWNDSESGRRPVGTAIRTGEPSIDQNINTDRGVLSWQYEARTHGYASIAAFPLRAGGGVLGALTVYAARPNAFCSEEVQLLQEIADNLAFGLASLKARSDRDEADRALRNSLAQMRDAHQRLRFHVSRMPLAFIAWDLDFRVTEWNPAAEQIFGWSASEAIGMHGDKLIVPEEAQASVGALWAKLLRGEDETSHSVNDNIHKDGRRLSCEWFNTPLRDDAGQVIGVLSMAHDITQRKNAEAERDRLEEQLRQSQKMEAVGRLAGGVAHDFNNLLTAILGYAELAMDQCDPVSPLHSELEQISRAGKQAASLTGQLLAFSRKQVIAPVVLDLNALVTQSRSLLRRLIGEDIELVFFQNADAGRIKADPGQIEQIILNLAANARDAMPRGDKLTFETASVVLTEEYVRAHAEAKPGRWAMLAASDNGQGMTEAVRQHLFEPFFTTKERGRGTGLGLATVYGIVKQNGGFISVYSEPGIGTTFKIFFPPVEDPAAATRGIEYQPLPPGKETILLVEDDDGVRELARVTLERRGYHVLIAPNAADAISIFASEGQDIDLLITDVIMPGMNGRELYERLSTMKSGLKALFMSGYTENVIAEHGILDAGINFIQKPYGIDQFTRKVHAILH